MAAPKGCFQRFRQGGNTPLHHRENWKAQVFFCHSAPKPLPQVRLRIRNHVRWFEVENFGVEFDGFRVTLMPRFDEGIVQ